MNSYFALASAAGAPALSGDLALVAEALAKLGIEPQKCRQWIENITNDPVTHTPVVALKQQLQESGVIPAGDALERLLLLSAGCSLLQGLDSLPVHPSVKKLLRQEIESWGRLRRSGRAVLEATTYSFSAASFMASGRRFPAGPMDWELSGIPRSWLLKIPRQDLPRIVWLTLRAGGFQPYFFMHVAGRPQNRALLLEKEVLRSHYRIARSLQMQPHIKGLIAAAWFFDRIAVQDNPHLEFLQRPYLEGGFITTMGPAEPTSGFAEHNPERLQKWERGELRYRIGLAVWPRAAAIQWADAHADLETSA